MDRLDARCLIEAAIGDGRREFGSFFLSRLFGMDIAYGEEDCTVAFDVQPHAYNPQGSLHGGVLAMALDISMGHLLQHRFGAGATLEMKVQYLSSIRCGRVGCRATFLKKGRRTFFLQSLATDAMGESIAHATATWRLL